MSLTKSTCCITYFQDLAEALFPAACHNVRNHLQMLNKQSLVGKFYSLVYDDFIGTVI